MVYLYVGDDYPAKNESLQKLKNQVLPAAVAAFNQDTLYAKELSLKGLQEKLLCLPLSNPHRMVIIREAQGLKKEVKDFLVGYCRKPSPHIVLVLDAEHLPRRDEGWESIGKAAKLTRFREEVPPTTFTLEKQIELRRTAEALGLLHRLLQEGERPERIMGGLRYAWERQGAHALETRRRLKYLLQCDVEIKTGKLAPLFALEKLVIILCGLRPYQK